VAKYFYQGRYGSQILLKGPVVAQNISIAKTQKGHDAQDDDE
jgi:hypothetical protein